MTTFFSDLFNGSAGDIIGHTPDTPFGGLAWVQDTGGSGTHVYLDGSGYAGPQYTSTIQTVGVAEYGVLGGGYGNPKNFVVDFIFRTGASVGSSGTMSHRGMTLTFKAGGITTSFRVWGYYSGGSITWYMNINATDVFLALSGVTANTEYAGRIVMADGLQRFEFLGNTIAMNYAYSSSAGLENISLDIGGLSKIASLSMDSLGAQLTAPIQTLSASGTVSLIPSIGSATFDEAPPMALLAFYMGGSAAITPPPPRIWAVGHDSTGEQAADLTAPAPTLAAYAGANARLSAPLFSLAATGTITNIATAALAAPTPTLSASGTTTIVAQAALSAPMAGLIGYMGAVCYITLDAVPTLQASGTTGGVGDMAAVCPLFELTASATVQNFGSADLLAPMPRLVGPGVAYAVAPMGVLTAIGHAVVTATYEAYAVNLRHRPPVNEVPIDEMTRYTNFPFDRVIRYKQSYFGVAADGLYLLEGLTDNGTAIPYEVKTCIDDFGSAERKTVNAAYFAGRLGPSATVTLYAGESGQESYAYTTPRGQTAINHREKFGKGVKNRYFALGIAGTDIMDLDAIEPHIDKLSRRI